MKLAGVALLLSLKPGFGYWQQEVHYKIEAEFFPKEDKIIGRQTLIYANNSPDTLKKIYFHLYINAFQPGSPMDLDSRRGNDYSLAKLDPKKWGKMDIKKLKVNQKEFADYKIDYSVMEIELPGILPPGKKVEFYFEFEDQIPANGARMGKQGKHYDIGQWYPKIAVYDRYGWHNEQYLGTGEFYGDFGKFEVSFTAPKEYILGHTGTLLNEEELFPGLPKASQDTVLFDILRKYREDKDTTAKEVVVSKGSKGGNQSDIKDQDNQPDSAKPEETKTWKISAENVHDFFIAANPDFIWDRAKWGDITINALYPKDAKEIWEKGAEETKFCLKLLSENFGQYPYRQFTSVAGAVRGGMEYPQIITMSKRIGDKQSHRFFSVLGHEIAHNWFYGLIGSNETRQACLDEGFASFATILLMEARYGRYNNSYTWTNFIQKKFYSNDDERTSYARNYLQRANQKREEPINTHSDRFVNPSNYRLAVYTKTASVMFMLQYILGDSLFDFAMKEYFRRWHWKHPYLDDFQTVMEEVSNLSLEWFFEQWFQKTWTVDYSIASVKNKRVERSEETSFLTRVKIRKLKEGVMPLDLYFKLPDGTTHSEKIPVEVWQAGGREYIAAVDLPGKPNYVELNPDQRVMDLNRLNNAYFKGLPTPFPKFKVKYNFLDKYNPVPLYAYQLLYNPSFWYNDVDGLKSGFHLKGSYLEWSHNLDLGTWIGPQSGRFHYDFSWKEPTFWLGNGTNFKLRSFYLEGRKGGEIGVEKDQIRRPQGREYFQAQGSKYGASIRAYRLKDASWLPPSVLWQRGDLNFASLHYQGLFPGHYYDQELGAYLSTSFFQSDFNFNKIFLEYKGVLDFGFSQNWSWRIAFGYASGDLPAQAKFYLASGSPLEEFDNFWYRSRGSLPNKWRQAGELYLPGGGNLRGYTDQNISGKKLFSLNFKWGIPNYLKLIPAKIPYLTTQLNSIKWEVFYDYGSAWDTKNPPALKDFFSDLGLGLGYKIPLLDQIFKESNIRFDFPFWLDKPKGSDDRFKFRWRFSVGKGVL